MTATAANLTMTPAAQQAEQESSRPAPGKDGLRAVGRRRCGSSPGRTQRNRQKYHPVRLQAEGMFLVDCGLSFPDDEMLGVDLVIPDFTYLERIRDKIQGLVLTHGHEDHIGAILSSEADEYSGLRHPPDPGTGGRQAQGARSSQHRRLNVVAPGDVVKFGCMSVEFINVNHSIPDACAMAIHTPAGVVIQTGDFKIDYTPIESKVINLARFGELGSKGVLALLSDSTNARAARQHSQRAEGGRFLRDALCQRQKPADYYRHLCLQHPPDSADCGLCRPHRPEGGSVGAGMVSVVSKALGWATSTFPRGVLIDIDAIGKYSDERLVICTTGSQGEPMSALFRMAMSDHRKVSVSRNDFIIISATPIPGNERRWAGWSTADAAGRRGHLRKRCMRFTCRDTPARTSSSR